MSAVSAGEAHRFACVNLQIFMSNTRKTILAMVHTPLWRRVQQDLRDKVESGVWTPGAMLPSRKSLAKAYGVDLRTVQRAVGELLADGTLDAEGGRGTFVGKAVRTANAGSGPMPGADLRAIAFIVNHSFSPADPGWHVTLQAMTEGVRQHAQRSRIMTFNTHGNTPEEMRQHELDALSVVERERFAGVVMGHSGGDAALPVIRRILSQGTPIVFIDTLPFKHGCDFVGIDNRMAAQEAVGYLLQIGHRRIAFLAPQDDVSTVRERFTGYQEAMRAAGAPISEDLSWRPALAKSLTRENLVYELDRIAESVKSAVDPPTAVFAVNDFLAQLLISAFERRGLTVPGSISVMGFDDVERYLPRSPILTTVRQPFEAIGLRAAEMLWQRIAGERGADEPFQHLMLPTSLVVRESTMPRLQR